VVPLILRRRNGISAADFRKLTPGYYLPARLATAAGATFAVAPIARGH